MSNTTENPIVLSAPVIKKIASAIVDLDDTGNLTTMKVLNTIAAQIAGPKKHWSYLTQATDTVVAQGMKLDPGSKILVLEMDPNDMMKGIMKHIESFNFLLDQADPYKRMHYFAHLAFLNFMLGDPIFDEEEKPVLLEEYSNEELEAAMIDAAEIEAQNWLKKLADTFKDRFLKEGSEVIVQDIVDNAGYYVWSTFESQLRTITRSSDQDPEEPSTVH